MSVQARRQEERSAATRHVLLEATVACLVDLGYTGTTSAAVAGRRRHSSTKPTGTSSNTGL